jgi:hypothetical protein
MANHWQCRQGRSQLSTDGGAEVDHKKHNYYKKLILLHEQGKIPTTALSEVDVYHDDWCGVHKGTYCNCDPTIEIRVQSSVKGEGRARLEAGAPLEETVSLQAPSLPCPHCGCSEFVTWRGADNPAKQAISCNGCGAVMSSTHPLDPENRPRRCP